MATAFKDPFPTSPIGSRDDALWLGAIRSVDEAVTTLLMMKQQMMQDDPVREHVLHLRHQDVLLRVKRKFDAVSW